MKPTKTSKCFPLPYFESVDKGFYILYDGRSINLNTLLIDFHPEGLNSSYAPTYHNWRKNGNIIELDIYYKWWWEEDRVHAGIIRLSFPTITRPLKVSYEK
jgi:hypothetical protein